MTTEAMIEATYVGDTPYLILETALLEEHDDPNLVWAQFDNRELEEAYGWREFPVTDFEFEQRGNMK